MKKRREYPWKIWAFVIALNIIGILGAFYLQSKGINVFALKSVS